MVLPRRLRSARPVPTGTVTIAVVAAFVLRASSADAGEPADTPAVESAADAASAAPPVDEEDLFVTEVAFGSSMSAVFFDTRRLDRAWTEAGAPGFVATQWTPFAVNGELWIGRHVPAFDLVETAQARPANVAGGVRTRLDTTWTELSYGYAAFHRGGLSIVPRLGFAIAEAVVTAQPEGEVMVDGVLADPRVHVRLSKGAMLTDLGAALSYLIVFGDRRRVGLGTGLRIGLRVGALVQLFDFGRQGDAWKAGHEPVAGAPDLRLDGGFVRLFVAPSLLHRSRRARAAAGESPRAGR